MGARWARLYVPAVLAVSAATLITFVIGSAVAHAAAPLPPRRRGALPSAIVALARKWAKARGLPLSWVLATIYAESQGNQNAVGDNGVSYGLMQINTRAHGERLAAAGVAPAMLLDPDTNIEWGTRILREAYDRAKRAGRPTDLGTRHVYVGYDAHTNNPATVARWQESLARTQALV